MFHHHHHHQQQLAQSYIDIWHEFCSKCHQLHLSDKFSPAKFTNAYQNLLFQQQQELQQIDTTNTNNNYNYNNNNNDYNDDDDEIFSSGLPLKTTTPPSTTTTLAHNNKNKDHHTNNTNHNNLLLLREMSNNTVNHQTFRHYVQSSHHYLTVLHHSLHQMNQLFLYQAQSQSKNDFHQKRTKSSHDNSVDSDDEENFDKRDHVQSCWMILSHHRVHGELDQIMYHLSSLFYQLFHEYHHDYDYHGSGQQQQEQEQQSTIMTFHGDNSTTITSDDDDEEFLLLAKKVDQKNEHDNDDDNSGRGILSNNNNNNHEELDDFLLSYMSASPPPPPSSSSSLATHDHNHGMVLDPFLMDIDLSELFNEEEEEQNGGDNVCGRNGKTSRQGKNRNGKKRWNYETVIRNLEKTVQVISSFGWLFYGVYCAYDRYKRRKLAEKRLILSLSKSNGGGGGSNGQGISIHDLSMISHEFENTFESSMNFLDIFSELYRIYRIVTSIWWNGGMASVLNWLLVRWVIRKLRSLMQFFNLIASDKDERDSDTSVGEASYDVTIYDMSSSSDGIQVQGETSLGNVANDVAAMNGTTVGVDRNSMVTSSSKTPKRKTSQRNVSILDNSMTPTVASDSFSSSSSSSKSLSSMPPTPIKPVASDVECVSEETPTVETKNNNSDEKLKIAFIDLMNILNQHKMMRETIEQLLLKLNDKQLYANCPKPISLTPKKKRSVAELKTVSWEEAGEESRKLSADLTTILDQHSLTY